MNPSCLFIEYPKCTTCQKAKKWLVDHNIPFTDRHIVEDRPRREELQQWMEHSGLPDRKWFNTSGILYKEMGLKDKLDSMTKEEKTSLLASNGMLVKRPVIVTEKAVLVGFQPEQWEKALLK